MKAYNNVNDSRFIVETKVPVFYKLKGSKIVIDTKKLKEEMELAISRIEKNLSVINGRIVK